MKLSVLLEGCAYRSDSDANDIEISDLCTHTRQIKEGDLFLLHAGEKHDPRTEITAWAKAGVRAVVLQEGLSFPQNCNIPCFYVSNMRLASAQIACRFYHEVHKRLTLIGITGTNGKTSTAFILSHILNHAGIHTGYIGTLGVYDSDQSLPALKEGEMTTPSPCYLFRALAELEKRGVTHVVMEVSSHALMQERVSLLHFRAAVFTNLSEDHLDYHKDMESYFAAKRHLFEQCDLAFINVDDAYGARLFQELSHRDVYDFGIIEHASFRLTLLHEKNLWRTHYTCLTPYAHFEIHLPLLGDFNLYNSLAAICVALKIGACPFQIADALMGMPQISGRMEKVDLSAYSADVAVFIDYAHTPDAVEKALKCVRKFTRGRIIAVLGAGGDREREKRARMGECAEKYADFIFVTSDNPRTEDPLSILNDIVSGMHGKEKYCVLPDRACAIKEALKAAQKDDAVLLLGKGHEEYMIEGTLKRPFSEKAIVHQYFQNEKSNYDN